MLLLVFCESGVAKVKGAALDVEAIVVVVAVFPKLNEELVDVPNCKGLLLLVLLLLLPAPLVPNCIVFDGFDNGLDWKWI